MNEYLRDWNKKHNERVKLQYAYAATALTLLVLAGLVGLLNDELGRTLLVYVFAITIIFFVNAIAWALLESFVLRRISTRTTTSKK